MRYIVLCLLLTIWLGGYAESMTLPVMVVLTSGQRVSGVVVMQNEEVIVLQTVTGQRFQFPMQQVERIVHRIAENNENEQESADKTKKGGRCAVRLSLSGGGSLLPNIRYGGSVAADAAIGYSGRCFAGVSIGYLGSFAGGSDHFLPLQAVASVPVTTKKNTPEVEFTAGYAFPVRSRIRPSKGGITASAALLYRWGVGEHSSVAAGLSLRLQQMRVSEKETIDGVAFSRTVTACSLMPAIRFCFQF